MVKKKVLLITEYLNPPYDEGIKKTVYNLFLALDKAYELKVICRNGFQKVNIDEVQTNKLFYSGTLKNKIQSYQPDTLIYFPFASSTFAGYLRFFVLSKFTKTSKNVFFALQPKKLKSWQKLILRFIKPNMALTPSPELHQLWNSLQVRNQLIPLQTNLGIFKPLKSNNKEALRAKYNLPEEAFIISHMGHLNEGRNLQSLIPLQKAGYQIVVVGSSSTPKDSLGPESLKKELSQAGIIILDGYIENIEEIYQLSDIYIFPVVHKTGSIGMPLSIMEARACGIPVVTTNFGSLKHFLANDFGNIFYASPDEFLHVVRNIANEGVKDRIQTKVHEINKQYLEIIHNTIESK